MASVQFCSAQILTVFIILLHCLAARKLAAATEFTVGDDSGWIIGTNYLRWSSMHNFTVGDTLVFNYIKGQHNVYQVTEGSFRSCDPSSGGIKMYNSGNDRVELTNATDYWFICSITFHCQDGMKFGVRVGNAIAAAPQTGDSATSPLSSSAEWRGVGWWRSCCVFLFTVMVLVGVRS